MAKLANALFLGWLFCGVLAADNAGRILSLQEGCELPGVKCHGLPGSCTKGSEVACEMMAKVSPTTNNTVHVQLEARANQTNLHLDMTSHWIAVGFSKSGKMPDSAVVHCIRNENGTAMAKLTYNVPDDHLNIGWKDVDQSPLEIISVEASDDTIKCAVNLSKKFSITNNGRTSEFDLNTAHHLLAATGPLVDGAISRHDRKPEFTEEAIGF